MHAPLNWCRLRYRMQQRWFHPQHRPRRVGLCGVLKPPELNDAVKMFWLPICVCAIACVYGSSHNELRQAMGGTALDAVQRLLSESSQWVAMRDIINHVEYRLPARDLSPWEMTTLVARGIIPSEQPNHPPLQPVEEAAGVSPRPIADAAGMPEAKASPSEYPPLHQPAAKMVAAVSFKQPPPGHEQGSSSSSSHSRPPWPPPVKAEPQQQPNVKPPPHKPRPYPGPAPPPPPQQDPGQRSYMYPPPPPLQAHGGQNVPFPPPPPPPKAPQDDEQPPGRLWGERDPNRPQPAPNPWVFGNWPPAKPPPMQHPRPALAQPANQGDPASKFCCCKVFGPKLKPRFADATNQNKRLSFEVTGGVTTGICPCQHRPWMSRIRYRRHCIASFTSSITSRRS